MGSPGRRITTVSAAAADGWGHVCSMFARQPGRSRERHVSSWRAADIVVQGDGVTCRPDSLSREAEDDVLPGHVGQRSDGLVLQPDRCSCPGCESFGVSQRDLLVLLDEFPHLVLIAGKRSPVVADRRPQPRGQHVGSDQRKAGALGPIAAKGSSRIAHERYPPADQLLIRIWLAESSRSRRSSHGL